MNRQQRLARALRGAEVDPFTIEYLASFPTEVVNQVVTALRASRRAGRQEVNSARVRRRTSRKRDVDQLASDAGRMLRNGLGRRAGQDLEALTLLKEHFKAGPRLLEQAVFALREEGIPDREIGAALGYGPSWSRQEMNHRFGPRSQQDTQTAGDGTGTTGEESPTPSRS